MRPMEPSFGENIHLDNHNIHYHSEVKPYKSDMSSAEFGM